MPFRDELRAAVVTYPVLEHPFYKAWTQGRLTTDSLAFYAAQYWHQVASFPAYLAAIADRLPPGRARQTIISNLNDEVEGDHEGLWLNFAYALGAPKDLVTSTLPIRETVECVTAFSEAATKASVPFSIGMLYGYESQTPEVAKVKLDGLRNHYGVDENGSRYFELHSELDVEHSAELEDAICELADDEQARAEAAAGAKAGGQAICHLLDGICRELSLN